MAVALVARWVEAVRLRAVVVVRLAELRVPAADLRTALALVAASSCTDSATVSDGGGGLVAAGGQRRAGGTLGLGGGLAGGGDGAAAEADGGLGLGDQVLRGLLGAQALDQLLAALGEVVVGLLGLAGDLEACG